MFTAMAGPLVFVVIVAVIALIVGAASEGRGRHIAREWLVNGRRPSVNDVYDDVPRPQNSLDLVGHLSGAPRFSAPDDAGR